MSYSGPRCYVPPGGVDIPAAFVGARDGATVTGRAILFGRFRKPTLTHLEGGWHYSTKVVYTTVDHLDPATGRRTTTKVRNEVPDRRLHLNDDDPGNLFYEYATDDHLSWHDKHGLGNVVTFHGLDGKHPAEAYDDHPNHERWKASQQ